MDNIFFTYLLLLMMEVLPLSTRITTASHRHRDKKSTQLCVGGKWFQVGSFRFWQRSKCGQRRQGRGTRRGGRPEPPKEDPPGGRPPGGGPPGGGPPGGGPPGGGPPGGGITGIATVKGGGSTASTVDLDLVLPSLEAGPTRGSTYNPNYGYEPYWANGDWVFDKDPYTKDSTIYMCGIRCPQVYTEFGTICGRDKDYNYKTFENYCQLRNVDCSGVDRWRVVYRGSCSNAFAPYDPDNVPERAKTFIEQFHQ